MNKYILFLFCLVMTSTMFGQKLKKKKPQYFLKLQGGLLHDTNNDDQFYEVLKPGNDYFGFNIVNLGLTKLKNNKIKELNFEWIEYNTEFIKSRSPNGRIYGFNREKVLLEIEYYTSLFHLGENRNRLYIGPTVSLGYNKNLLIPKERLYFPYENICYCVSSGIKLLYNFNITKKIILNISSKVTLIDLGYYINRRLDPNLPRRAQSDKKVGIEFWRDQYQLMIGFNYKIK